MIFHIVFNRFHYLFFFFPGFFDIFNQTVQVGHPQIFIRQDLVFEHGIPVPIKPFLHRRCLQRSLGYKTNLFMSFFQQDIHQILGCPVIICANAGNRKSFQRPVNKYYRKFIQCKLHNTCTVIFPLHAHQNNPVNTKFHQLVNRPALCLHVSVGTLQNHMIIFRPTLMLNPGYQLTPEKTTEKIQNNTNHFPFSYRFYVLRHRRKILPVLLIFFQHKRPLSRHPNNNISVSQHFQSLFTGDSAHIILFHQFLFRRKLRTGRIYPFFNSPQQIIIDFLIQ